MRKSERIFNLLKTFYIALYLMASAALTISASTQEKPKSDNNATEKIEVSLEGIPDTPASLSIPRHQEIMGMFRAFVDEIFSAHTPSQIEKGWAVEFQAFCMRPDHNDDYLIVMGTNSRFPGWIAPLDTTGLLARGWEKRTGISLAKKVVEWILESQKKPRLQPSEPKPRKRTSPPPPYVTKAADSGPRRSIKVSATDLPAEGEALLNEVRTALVPWLQTTNEVNLQERLTVQVVPEDKRSKQYRLEILLDGTRNSCQEILTLTDPAIDAARKGVRKFKDLLRSLFPSSGGGPTAANYATSPDSAS